MAPGRQLFGLTVGPHHSMHCCIPASMTDLQLLVRSVPKTMSILKFCVWGMQRGQRDDLRLIVMSATLDVMKFSSFLDNCCIAYVQVPAWHPVLHWNHVADCLSTCTRSYNQLVCNWGPGQRLLLQGMMLVYSILYGQMVCQQCNALSNVRALPTSSAHTNNISSHNLGSQAWHLSST